MTLATDRNASSVIVAGSGAAPLVSVLIPAYNCGRYLGRALDSVLAGQGVSLEVIVVDDASSDDTAAVALAYADRGPVRLLRNEGNRGVSYSRNRAMREARGEWLALLDGDDWFGPGRLAALLALARESGADLVADDMFLVDDASGHAYSTRLIDNQALPLAPGLVSPARCVRLDLGSVKPLMRRGFVVAEELFYPESLRYGEDFVQLLRALLAGGRLAMAATPGYYLRRGNTGSATRQRLALATQVAAATRELLADPRVHTDGDLVLALNQRLRQAEEMARLSRWRHDLGRGLQAWWQLARQPELLGAFARSGLGALQRRWNRRRHRARLAGAVHGL